MQRPPVCSGQTTGDTPLSMSITKQMIANATTVQINSSVTNCRLDHLSNMVSRLVTEDGVMGLRRRRYFLLFGPLLLVLMMPTKSTIPNYLSCFVSGPNFNGKFVIPDRRSKLASYTCKVPFRLEYRKVPRSSLKLNADSAGPLAHQVQEPTFDWYVPRQGNHVSLF
ncbi:hypothetical protein KSS87_010153 [Heliosperma pusillum]|nr:hypothetical protein KSS87_010153 [Heliosperma pusillum]